MGNLRDEELVGGVVAALARDGRVNSADRVKVSARRGTVTLSGIVRSFAEKAAAGEVASRVPGVGRVENALTVTMDGTIADHELQAEVAKALARAPEIALRDVGAVVADGVVTLVGHARDAARELAAIQAAGSVKGVKDVVSALTLDQEVEAVGLPVDDTTLANRANAALADAGLDLPSLEVHVDGGVVYLDGLAASDEDRRRATETVQRLVGVDHVVNRLVLARSAISRDPDQRLIARVLQALHEDGRASPRYVRVTAHQGVVHLAGQVDSIEQHNAAVELAGAVPGVRSVVNELLLTDRTSLRSEDKGLPAA